MNDLAPNNRNSAAPQTDARTASHAGIEVDTEGASGLETAGAELL